MQLLWYLWRRLEWQGHRHYSLYIDGPIPGTTIKKWLSSNKTETKINVIFIVLIISTNSETLNLCVVFLHCDVQIKPDVALHIKELSQSLSHCEAYCLPIKHWYRICTPRYWYQNWKGEIGTSLVQSLDVARSLYWFR